MIAIHSEFADRDCRRSASALTFLFVDPADAAAVVVRLQEQLSEELPQVDGLVGIFTDHVGPGVIVGC